MKLKSTIVTALVLFALGCQKESVEGIPEFDLLLSDSITKLNTANIPKGRPIVMIHFDADCRECQQETDSLLQNMAVLKDVNFYFLTIGGFWQVKIFKDYFHLDRYSNITIGRDSSKTFARYYNTYSTPLIVLYDKRKRLSAVYRGKPNIEDLINQIETLK